MTRSSAVTMLAVGMLRIIGGEHRSRRLLAPPDDQVSRPYTQRARETLFNLLRGWFDSARVLDLFAGVGTMGLEAVSRGAASVVMIERDRRIHRRLVENIERLGCGDRATAVHGDAFAASALLRAPAPVDVVFVDPPYPMMGDESGRRRVLDLLARCRSVMADRGFVVLRSPAGPETFDLAVPGLEGPEAHRFSADMWLLLYAPAVAGPEPEATPATEAP